jgi:glutathione synthase/RimK-type ligase-like ATP-grasp enzyme
MSAVLLRRRGLGKGSCNGVTNVSTTGIKVVRNFLSEDWPEERMNYVFRWGCTSSIPAIPDEAPVIVNTAKAIHWCSDKRQGRLDMQAAGVPVPETWGNHNQVPADVGLVVFRPDRHAQGRNLFLVDTGDAGWQEALTALAGQFSGHYISRLIPKVAEYRVMVVQNRVAWVAKKTPGNPEDVAWNVARGGRFDNVKWGEWPGKVVYAALQAAAVGKLDFGGVDVMVDAAGEPYVLEVNSAPSQTSPYRQQCLAKCFDYIVTNGKEHFPDPTGLTWKSYIHPAVWS